MITLREAAKMLGVSEQKLYHLDHQLNPIFQNRGVNNRMKTRLYDPVIVSSFIGKLQARTYTRRGHKPSTPEEMHDVAVGYFWNSHLHGCKVRGLTNGIKLNKFKKLIKLNCAYCGKGPEFRKFGKYQIPVNGLDRVNSTKHYTAANVVACCKLCNRMKNNLTVSEFLNHTKLVANFNSLHQATETTP